MIPAETPMTAGKFKAALGVALTQFALAVHDGNYTPSERWVTASLLASAALVWLLPNKPKES